MVISMLCEKKNCSGCAACYNACPHNAIEMIPDKIEGFLYPVINQNKCVNCRLCERVCPILSPVKHENSKNINCYAAVNIDDDTRRNSSSGGLFYLLASRIIEEGGVVFGATISADVRRVQHVMVDTVEDLPRIMGSKYVQSEIGSTYSLAKQFLTQGKKVLFSGCACQISGLKNYLGKDYSDLYTIDVICHGTPSPKVWNSYIASIEKECAAKVKEVSFRFKQDTWQNFSVRRVDENHKEIIIPHTEDYFMSFFLRNYCLRESCYHCSAKENKCSDITLGDFWGINNIAPEMNDGIGTSVVIVRTDRGSSLFNKIDSSLNRKEVTYEEAVKDNYPEYKSVPRPPERDLFFNDLNTIGFVALKEKYAKDLVTREKAKKSIKFRVKQKIKAIIRGGG